MHQPADTGFLACLGLVVDVGMDLRLPFFCLEAGSVGEGWLDVAVASLAA